MKILQLFLLFVGMVLSEKSNKILEEFSMGYNEFTAAVYKQLMKSRHGNMMVCPLSAEIILALTHVGAGGDTAKQLSNGLHLPENKDKIQEMFLELSPLLMGNKAYTLNSANKIYVKDGCVIKTKFNSTAVEVFKAEIANINFEQRQQAADEINKWVEQQTHDKITNIIDKGDLVHDTRVVLINAMYFHGNWTTPFNTKDTQKKPFYLNKQRQVLVDMMDKTGDFKLINDFDLKAEFLELPYEGGDITMTIVLPYEADGLPNLENRILELFGKTFDGRTRKVHVMMPKFKFETTVEFTDILQALGVTDAFTVDSNIQDIVEDKSLTISKVIQKTFIEVEETGTTAAAATAVHGITLFSKPPSPSQFIADHPFIFWIKIKNVILFTGRYSSPTD